MSYAERIGAIRHLGYAMADAVLGAAQIASEADDVIAAKDAEIARLREALGELLESVDSPVFAVDRVTASMSAARAALAKAGAHG